MCYIHPVPYVCPLVLGNLRPLPTGQQVGESQRQAEQPPGLPGLALFEPFVDGSRHVKTLEIPMTYL